MAEYTGPKERYLIEPKDESCYEYLQNCYTRIAKDHGDYTAFVNQDCKTSMKKMFEDIENLAGYLTECGFKRGDVITIFLPTSAHAFVAFYALNKLGIIANFVHPLTPPDALKEMLELTGSKALFILDRAIASFTSIVSKTHTIVCSTSDYTSGIMKFLVKLDDNKNSNVPDMPTVFRYRDVMKKKYPSVNTVSNPGKETLIYLHGGGTTGKSKTIKHSSFSLNSLAYKLYLLDRDHNYGDAYNICALPCFHAFGLGGAMHYALCNAYSAILVPKFDAVKVNNYIKKYHVQEILGVPNMFQKMYNADNFVNPGLKNLNLLFSGGDILSESFVNEFTSVLRANSSKAKLFRGWGLTEMCAICTTCSADHYKPDSIGMPLEGVKIRVLDADGKVLPAGEVGELSLSGDTMMNGYLSDGIVKESGIVKDENGVDWVNTGDMGYVDEDGFAYFTGRKKRIIIISGYNIYPYTMEQKIMTLDFIKEACAVQGYDNDKKPCVKLCVSLNDSSIDKEKTKKEILNFCETNLDRFSVPRKIEFMDALPRTKIEKLDFMKMSDKVPN